MSVVSCQLSLVSLSAAGLTVRGIRSVLPDDGSSSDRRGSVSRVPKLSVSTPPPAPAWSLEKHFNRHILPPAKLPNPGRVPKWPTGSDCKSDGLCLRRFESFRAQSMFSHQKPAFSGGFLRFHPNQYPTCISRLTCREVRQGAMASTSTRRGTFRRPDAGNLS